MTCTFLPARELVGTIFVPTGPVCSDGLLQGKAYSLYFTVVKRRSTFQTFFDFSTLVEWKTFCFFFDINNEARYTKVFWEFKARKINLVEVGTSLIRTSLGIFSKTNKISYLWQFGKYFFFWNLNPDWRLGWKRPLLQRTEKIKRKYLRKEILLHTGVKSFLKELICFKDCTKIQW